VAQSAERRGPVSWVQLLQALVSREGVEQAGLSARRVAELLGIAPSAVSQYLSGRRLGARFLEYSTDERARTVARDALERMAEAQREGRRSTKILLEAAGALSELAVRSEERGDPRRPRGEGSGSSQVRQLARWVRLRVKAEQVAVSQCMRLAQRARDEPTRALLRQIASDSLRHAEIVASLAPYLDRGVSGTFAAGITRQDVERLIEAERIAESSAGPNPTQRLRGTMAILVGSMEADERKHTALLRALLDSGFPP
jgi:predicted transcriptional regulator